MCNRERAFVELDGAARLAERAVRQSEVAEVIALTAFVANRLGNRERAFVELDGAARLAEVAVRIAEVAEASPFAVSAFEFVC